MIIRTNHFFSNNHYDEHSLDKKRSTIEIVFGCNDYGSSGGFAK